MEQIADVGNGSYAYIDSLKEGHKVLVQEMASTLFTIARDVKIQVEFNPKVIAEYRLIGYENRALKREDFNNDKVDAGDIGAGHTVTALYEIALVGGKGQQVDQLRYRDKAKGGLNEKEFGFLKLRYKGPDGGDSKLMKTPLLTAWLREPNATPSDDFRFAAAVAAFGQKLRGGKYVGGIGFDGIIDLASGARGGDTFGYRAEFTTLVRLTKSLKSSQVGQAR